MAKRRTARPSKAKEGPPARDAVCDHCGSTLRAGAFAVTIAYDPEPSARPDPVPVSRAAFRICPDCARAVLQWLAEGPAAPQAGPPARG